jgi:hypothetical protein
MPVSRYDQLGLQFVAAPAATPVVLTLVCLAAPLPVAVQPIASLK